MFSDIFCIPYQYKNQEIYDRIIPKYFFSIKHVQDQYKSQQICD